MKDLIARLERLTGPLTHLGSRYDLLKVGEHAGLTDDELVWLDRALAGSLDAAVAMVQDGWRWNASNRASAPHAGRAHVENKELHTIGMGGVTPNPKLRWYECTASTPALALCIAALKAREAS